MKKQKFAPLSLDKETISLLDKKLLKSTKGGLVNRALRCPSGGTVVDPNPNFCPNGGSVGDGITSGGCGAGGSACYA
nr:class I lanthipeptide [uncultured Chryseobacterium sp.]